MYNVTNYKTFSNRLRDKLISENIISLMDDIDIEVSDINPHHYLLNVKNKNQKFIVKKVKEKEYSYFITEYLQKINRDLGTMKFPLTLIPPFSIAEHTYVICTYLDGKALTTLIPTLSNNDLQQISLKIDENLKYIHSITSNSYFEGNSFKSQSFSEIIIKKISDQLHNKYVRNYLKNINIDKLFVSISDILSRESYSQPILLHMDINPGNIILSPSGDVHIIDFELARFGELEYGWVNLLSKTLHHYDMRYKQCILYPILEKNFMLLDKAMKKDKYKIYMLYHSVNMYIYCSKFERKCPKEILELIDFILEEFTV